MKLTQDDYGYTVCNDAEEKLVYVETREVEFPGPNGYEEITICEISGITPHTKDLAILTAAMKLVIDKIEEDFGNIPSIPKDLNAEEKDIVADLFAQGLLSKKSLQDPELDDYEHDFGVKDTKKNLTSASVVQKTPGNTRSGHLPKGAKIEKRKPRSYANERPQQTLRHIATQLFNYCTNLKLDPVEVQIMYMRSKLFIATNVVSVTKAMFSQLLDLKSLQTALVTPYAKRIELEAAISQRFATKIAQRMLQNKQPSNPIARLLTSGSIKEINVNKLNKDEINATEAIYFVTDVKPPARHAEENLLDIFDAIFDLEQHEAIIYGKKRPCFNCHSRLESTNQDFDNIKFNPFKGLFFKEDYYKQGPAMTGATAEQLAYTGTVYESSPGGSGYCTMSDTEAEESEEVRLSKSLKTKATIT